MNKRKILGLVALGASVVLVALTVVCMLMAVKHFGVGHQPFTHSRAEIDAPILNVSMKASSTALSICPTEAEQAYVEIYDRESAAYRISAENGTLVIEGGSRRAWYEQLGIFPETPAVTLYLPKGMYGDLSVKSSCGEIKVSTGFLFRTITLQNATGNIQCRASAVERIAITGSTGHVAVESLVSETIELWTSTGSMTVSSVTCTDKISISAAEGRVEVTDTTCKRFSSTGTSGRLYMKNVIVRRSCSIDRTSGSLEIDGCDADAIYLVTKGGNVTASWLSPKKFDVSTSGKKDVPATTSGKRCRVSAGSGNVKMSILGDAE